jgi:hypothetical protein
LWLRKGTEVVRLDFGHHQANHILDALLQHERFGWQQLQDVADIFRGDVSSPEGPRRAVHTTDFRNGFWRRSDRHKPARTQGGDRRVRRGDLLVTRVGRNCHSTFGRPVSLRGMSCSDCVFLIRPKKPGSATKILFALRALFELGVTRIPRHPSLPRKPGPFSRGRNPATFFKVSGQEPDQIDTFLMLRRRQSRFVKRPLSRESCAISRGPRKRMQAAGVTH